LSEADLLSVYQARVLDRARNPRFAVSPAGAVRRGEGRNALCGDRVDVALTLDPSSHIDAIGHVTRGCAICQASADLMAEAVRGLNRHETDALYETFQAILDGGMTPSQEDVATQDERVSLLRTFSSLSDFRSRHRCATLPWSALQTALAERED
jgi:nitrogen fixation protein NifU and related proteins